MAALTGLAAAGATIQARSGFSPHQLLRSDDGLAQGERPAEADRS